MSDEYLTRDIVIPLCDFLEIRDDADSLDLLLEVIFNSARLGYDEDSLRFDASELSSVLKYIAPNKYARKLNKLKELASMKAPNGNVR